MLSSRGKFWDYLRKLASSRVWFWFQSVLEGYFNFFQQKRPLPVRVFENCFNILNKISRVFFTGTFQFSRKEFPKIFTYTQICFHACDFKDIFTETFRFSRVLFKFFSRRPRHFHGQKHKNFHAQKKFFTRKKKHCSGAATCSTRCDAFLEGSRPVLQSHFTLLWGSPAPY